MICYNLENQPKFIPFNGIEQLELRNKEKDDYFDDS